MPIYNVANPNVESNSKLCSNNVKLHVTCHTIFEVQVKSFKNLKNNTDHGDVTMLIAEY